MDAPLYPPTAAYEQPVFVPQAILTGTVSIAELLDDAEAKAILEATAPGLAARTDAGPLAPHRDALSFRSLVTFRLATAGELDRIDAELAKLNARRVLRP